ncbi:zinc knuckle CX2CX4HX4C containing protein [Tanacetum coccineum]
MAIMAKNVIAASAKNRPPMLEKGVYDSWKTRIMLYIEEKENGEMLVDSIKHGPFQLKEEFTILATKDSPEIKRKQTLEDLTPKELLRKSCDIKATNTIFSQRYPDPLALMANTYNPPPPPPYNSQISMYNPPSSEYHPYQSYQPVTSSIPSFLPTDDLIANFNKEMLFLNTTMNSIFPPTNKQLRTSPNQRTQATVQDGCVTVQNIKGLYELITVPSVVSSCEPIDTHENSDPIVQSVDINNMPTSYAGAAGANNKDQPKVMSNFRHLVAYLVFNGVDISIPRKVVEKVSSRFENTLYGYFIGKRMAFPVVEYYARNNWGKHGLKRIMMNSKGFFFFKFESQSGLEVVLEGGPWLIRKALIILKKWSTDTKLLKEELTRIPIWVKLHDVPLQVFEEDGISLIASFIGKPVMLDSYTSSMCNDSWGRSSFARCLIKVNSEADLVEAVTIGIPLLTGEDFTKETIRVEYEWRPPICDELGKKKKKKGKTKTSNSGQFVGPSIHQNFRYEPKASTSPPKKVANMGNVSISSSLLKNKVTSSHQDNITSLNSFSALNVEDDEEEEEVENVYDETANLINTKTGGRSSFTAVVG